MPISHEHKIVFIHIPKNAGTTVEFGLGMNREECLYSSIAQMPKYNVFPQHLFGSEILEIVPEAINYRKFSIVRNPYDRMESEYHYQKCNSTHFHKKIKNMRFSEFIEFATSLNEPDRSIKFDRHMRLQCEFIDIPDVKIYKFENLKNCLSDFNIQNIHLRKSTFANEVWDTKSRNIVRDFFEKDFRIFDY